MTQGLVPDDLDGETALALADLLYRLADEIMNRNDGAIRIHLDELREARHHEIDLRQLPLPLPASHGDWPF